MEHPVYTHALRELTRMSACGLYHSPLPPFLSFAPTGKRKGEKEGELKGLKCQTLNRAHPRVRRLRFFFLSRPQFYRFPLPNSFPFQPPIFFSELSLPSRSVRDLRVSLSLSHQYRRLIRPRTIDGGTNDAVGTNWPPRLAGVSAFVRKRLCYRIPK